MNIADNTSFPVGRQLEDNGRDVQLFPYFQYNIPRLHKMNYIVFFLTLPFLLSSTNQQPSQASRRKLPITTSLVGKRSTIIQQLGWWNCAGWMSQNDKTAYGLERIALSREECNSGAAKIILTKLIYRNSSGKPVKDILDELNIVSSEKVQYGFAYCKEKTSRNTDTHLVKYRNLQRSDEIEKIWRIDYKLGKIVEVKDAKSMMCLNEYE